MLGGNCGFDDTSNGKTNRYFFPSKTHAVKTNRDCIFCILLPVPCQNNVLPSKCNDLLLIYYRFLFSPRIYYFVVVTKAGWVSGAFVLSNWELTGN